MNPPIHVADRGLGDIPDALLEVGLPRSARLAVIGRRVDEERAGCAENSSLKRFGLKVSHQWHWG